MNEEKIKHHNSHRKRGRKNRNEWKSGLKPGRQSSFTSFATEHRDVIEGINLTKFNPHCYKQTSINAEN